jgi:translocation and assembly module TamB
MTRSRRIAWALALVAGALALLAALVILTVRSPWFYEKVRQRLVETIETATGGRVEIGSFRFDWTRLRAEVTSLTLHGLEPADKPPLLRCASAAVGLKILSLWKRDVDIRYLDVNAPRVYLIVQPDGSTNIPHPKVKGKSNAIETILKLAIGRLDIAHGELTIEAQCDRPPGLSNRTGQEACPTKPFELHGQNLAARLSYEALGPRYRGDISVQPLILAERGPIALEASVTLERNRIGIQHGSLTMGGSQASFSGTIDDIASPHGAFRYDARVTTAEAARILRTRLLDRGTVQSSGNLTWRGGGDFSLDGSFHAYGLEYRDPHVRLHGFEADGRVAATPAGIDTRGLRLSGHVTSGGHDVPVAGQVATATLRGSDIEAHGIALELLGGSFHGEGTLRRFERFHVEGEIAGFNARRVVALYSKEELPWDALASGAIRLDGGLGRPNDLRAQASLAISPAPASEPVHGQVEATYDAHSGTLDLGNTTLSLPSTTATASGAIGHELRVHLETRDLHDLLPVLGQSAASLPLTLQSAAKFDGTVTGSLQDPRIAGALNVGPFSYQNRQLEALHADVIASPENVRLSNATLTRDGWRAQFEGAVALADWKIADSSQIFGSGSVQNAPVADLSALAGESLPVNGTFSATAQVKGTVGSPLVDGSIAVARGAYRDEPFDSLTARVSYANRTLQLAGGQLASGPKQVQLSATYTHQQGDFAKGRIEFQVATNAMPLDQIRTVQNERPGVAGTVQINAHGTLDVPFRIEALNADISGHGLQLDRQSIGDLHLTAQSQGQLLTAHMESDFASSSIKGDGKWRLEGDYPGTADITFAKLDFAQLRSWLLPANSTVAADLTGHVAGSLHIEGPAFKRDAIKAELRVPEVEIGIAPANLTLRNSGPFVVAIANSAATIQSARLTGRNTDLSLTGKIALQGKSSVDVRVAGRVDLAIVHDWNRDFTAGGVLDADATVRGSFDSPQIAGRVAFTRASFNIADVPNGISNATGAIIFSGNRATIQSFTGETGGGRIQLFGFAAYGGGPTIFRVHAGIDQVRVRYPEGVSTVANASLNLTGSTDRSMLAGTITVLRTTFNPQSDFSSVIAHSAEPIRAPAAQAGFLGGLNFDINIETSPDVQVQSALTQDVQLEANLHLRGTVSAPALLGRVNITQGQIVFFGTRYRIGQGSISFFNPLTIEPVLDIDLETKARGIDVTLTVSGPLNKLALSYRSDPPLQFSEIVALLATGRTPTNEATLMSSQNPAAQSFQQMGASALLGQAISSPVTGRLQRFFGVSRLRIDPTLPGVEYNPQARLTLEQQVTQDITFTYITDVTSTNPQVVSVEWAFAKQWSVVAQRDENGMIGMDIFFKRRF